MKKISVLVTFYNQVKYVDRALSSIINQIVDFDLEILVGDDGSNDGTRERILDWISKYPDMISLYIMDRAPAKYIAGFRASRNRLNLLKHVNSEYFVFLDGDDYFDYEYKLKRQVEILENEKYKDCIACGHDIDMLYADGKRTSLIGNALKEGKVFPKQYWGGLYFHTDTLLIRSSVISRIDFDLLENNFNDNLITYSIIQFGNIYYLPYSWCVYFQSGDGVWTSGNKVINYIRNIFLYDLCNKINKQFKRETNKRFSDTWYSLYKIRKQIKTDELSLLAAEAENKGLVNSYKWIQYSKLEKNDRVKLCIKSLLIGWKSIVYHFLKRLHKH